MKTESEINQCLDRILADDKFYADEYRDGFRCALSWVLGDMHNTLFEEPIIRRDLPSVLSSLNTHIA